MNAAAAAAVLAFVAGTLFGVLLGRKDPEPEPAPPEPRGGLTGPLQHHYERLADLKLRARTGLEQADPVAESLEGFGWQAITLGEAALGDARELKFQAALDRGRP